MKKMVKWLIICSWAALLVQAPAFMDQYINHLAGHTHELKIQDKVIKEMMGEDNLSLLAVKMKESKETYALKQADYLTYFVLRKESFDEAFQSLTQAKPWSLPFFFLRHFNTEIGRETVETFNFGFPITLNGAIYLLLGGLIGFLNWMGLVHLFRKEMEPEELGI